MTSSPTVAAPEPQAASARPQVALCEHAAAAIGLPALRAALARADPGVAVEVVEGLCRGLDRPRDDARGRLAVAGVCALPAPWDELRAQASSGTSRSPELVSLALTARAQPAERRASDAATLLAAAAARGRAPQLPAGRVRTALRNGPLSRRGLFSRRVLVQLPAAAVDRDACLGVDACGLCLDICPERAIGKGSEHPLVDPQRCEACGICVTSCPTGALGLPGVSLAGFEAELTVLLTSAEQPAGILLACRHGLEELERRAGLSSPPAGSRSRCRT